MTSTVLDYTIATTLSGMATELTRMADGLMSSPNVNEWKEESKVAALHARFALAFHCADGLSFYTKPSEHPKLLDVGIAQYLYEHGHEQLLSMWSADPSMDSQVLDSGNLSEDQISILNKAAAHATGCSVDELKLAYKIFHNFIERVREIF